MRPSFRRSVLLCTLAATVAACDSGLGPDDTLDSPLVEVTTTTVAPGAIVELLARNASATSWYYNTCSSPRLQRREGDAWIDTPDPLLLCAPDQLRLDGGEQVTIGVGVPAGVVAGTYRIRFRVARRDGVEVSPSTNTFTVAP
ncbi:MAG: hypothetical protein IPJ78_14660 [Gemmatimonadetes bacterium]|nr:hypothetical protein [Gemmatimonadota bacterium]